MRHRISVIGADEVGHAVARRLAARDDSELVLCDARPGDAQVRALDLNHAAALSGYEPCLTPSEVYEEIGGSELVVLTGAHLPATAADSPDERFTENASALAQVADEVARHAPDAIVLVLAQPADALCEVVLERTRFPRGRVIGIAGSLSGAALRARLAHQLRISVRDISVVVLGGPGPRTVPLASHMAAGGIPVAQLLAPGRLEATLTWMAERRLEPPEAAAAAAAELVEAIVLDQRRLLCCAVQCQGEFGIDGLVAGVPVKVGKDGVGEILELALSDSEREALHEACAASHRLARAFLDA